VNSARVQAALEAASGVIDSYAGGRYTLPLAPSQQVVDLCLRITIYKLWEGRQRQAPEIVEKSYDDAILFLKDVSAGKAMLDQPATPQGSGLEVQKRDHTADPERIDDNKLDAY
jgi:phage gp36-like protein